MYLNEKIIFCFYFAFISFTVSFAQGDGWELQESGTDAGRISVKKMLLIR
jgi:hypothetical protein